MLHTIYVQLIGTPRVELQLAPVLTAQQLHDEIGSAVGRPTGSFKVVRAGSTLPCDDSMVKMSDRDTVLVVPNRKAPSPRLVSAVLSAQSGTSSNPQGAAGWPGGGGGGGEGEEEEDAPAQLPATAPAWERAVVEAARRAGWAPWAVDWVILIRPMRMLMLVLFCVGCLVSSKLQLGPVFILLCIITAIVSNLGQKKEGEVSAYSICNPGVERLPGQLDADDVDQQIRRGQI